jgi:F0F1-type ATP synthase membrane subunit b/b'
MNRVRAAVAKRGAKVVAKVSETALDAIEAVEKVEGALARAPDKLKEMRTKAVDGLADARRTRATEAREAARPAAEPRKRPAAKGPSPLTSEQIRATGRKAISTATAAKQLRKPSGPKVKRGQKHNHHR